MTNTNKLNIKKAQKVDNSENKSSKQLNKTKKMKLPTIRKIHVNPIYLGFGVVIAVLLLFFARVAIWEHSYLQAMEGSERATTVSGASGEVTVDPSLSDDTDTTKPTEKEIVEYNVAPDKPRYLTIPYLGLYNVRIVEIGTKGQNEMDTPRNIYDVGWFTGAGSVVPGETGVSVLNAHGGDLGNGIFRTLPKLPVGQEIKIEMGDGRVFTYKVVESVRKKIGADADQYMTTAFQPLSGTSNTLSMITCTGTWLATQNTYDERLFVRAVME